VKQSIKSYFKKSIKRIRSCSYALATNLTIESVSIGHKTPVECSVCAREFLFVFLAKSTSFSGAENHFNTYSLIQCSKTKTDRKQIKLATKTNIY